MHPERTQDLYFVADGSGGHVFARTLADQTRNIAHYLRGAAAETAVAAPAVEPIPPAGHPDADKPRAAKPDPAAHNVPHRAGKHRHRRAAKQAERVRHCHRDARHRCRH